MVRDGFFYALGLGAVAAVLWYMSMPAWLTALPIVLAIFSAFFLYIGASDLLPESHHAHPKFLTTAMTVLGAALVYAVNAAMS